MPYKAFDGIIDELSRFLSQQSREVAARLVPKDAWILTRVFPVLERVAAFAESKALDVTEPRELRAKAFAALRELFTRLGLEYRLLLYIDDLQWADADSHLLLVDLLRLPAAPRLCLVATARPPTRPDEPLARLEHSVGWFVEVPLSPLSLDESWALAASVLGTQQAELCSAIARDAAGHPLLLQTLCQHARRTGTFQVGAVRLDDAIFSHIEGVSVAARRLLELIALSGAPLASEVARQASELGQAEYAASRPISCCTRSSDLVAGFARRSASCMPAMRPRYVELFGSI